ncbi:patched domain-containing protein 3-like isoform X2 [Mercenaria mercenaria]|uniref:patched domain-containing protein 3-like isoform X2 n=1 Tax=Mercenaria mercenaria TaxID=6596 RepID=UPI00234EB291|nr:patched domain-containing protein 3-like isoform X2 [Mercenaria mercenaria]
MTCFKNLYERVEKKIGTLFALYGLFVSRHAWKMIIITVTVNGLLGIGLVRFKWNKDVKHMFLPKGSEAEKDEEQAHSIFPDLSGSNFDPRHQTTEGYWARVILKSTTGNLLEKTVLEEIKNFSSMIENISITNETGSMVQFSEICAKAFSKCYIDGDIVWDADFITAVENDQLTYPVFLSPTFGPRYYAFNTGGRKSFDSLGQYLRGTELLKLEYTVRSDTENSRNLASKWVNEFKAKLESYRNRHFEIAYGHFNSLDEELHENIIGDILLFAATISLMMVYACVATMSARCSDQLGQRMLLGLAGLTAAGLATLGSFGLCAAIGIDFVNILGVVPFLITEDRCHLEKGIGIDDMFLLLSGLSESQVKDTPEEKIAETMRISCVGITITTLTDVIAFMSGIGSTFVAVRNFCIYTGVAVFFCYINNVTFFAACIVINERRVKDRRHFLTCKQIKTKEELREVGKSQRYVFCCGGRAPRNREEAESWIDKFPRWIIPKIVLKLPFKVIIIIMFMGYMAGAIYGCINIKQGILLTQLANFDSYFYKFSDWNEKFFPRQTGVSFIIQDTYDYSDNDTQSKLFSLVSEARSSRYFDDNFEVNWLKSYSLSMYYNTSSKSAFIAGLQRFLSVQQNAAFENDVVIDDASKEITASRVYVVSSNLAGSQEDGKMMLESRSIASAAEIDCFALSPLFVYYEQFVLILEQTMQSVGIALASVFVVTCIFMPHPVLVVFVTIVVTMIMTGVFGYMLYIDVALSAITMIQLIMCIGFSVDFSAHICHGYMISNGQTRDMKVKHAIDETGAPIFHGAVSSLIGIVVLNVAKSYIFRTFAAVLSFVLFFGVTHALLLLPVVLSCIGPLNKKVINTEEEKSSTKEDRTIIPSTAEYRSDEPKTQNVFENGLDILNNEETGIKVQSKNAASEQQPASMTFTYDNKTFDVERGNEEQQENSSDTHSLDRHIKVKQFSKPALALEFPTDDTSDNLVPMMALQAWRELQEEENKVKMKQLSKSEVTLQIQDETISDEVGFKHSGGVSPCFGGYETEERSNEDERKITNSKRARSPDKKSPHRKSLPPETVQMYHVSARGSRSPEKNQGKQTP